MTRPAADSFARTVTNVVGYPIGIETVIGLGSAMVEVWRPIEGTWVFTRIEVSEDMESITRYETVAIVRGDLSGWEVIDGPGSMTLGEFRGGEAAVGFAFDKVCGPAWALAIQAEHDSVSV